MRNLSDVFTAIRSWTPESLIGDEGWQLLTQKVGHLPADAAKFCAFELELDDPNPVADFAVALTAGETLQHYIDEGSKATQGTVQAWLGEYLANWPDNRFESVWLAYDVTRACAKLPMIDLMPSMGDNLGMISVSTPSLAELLCTVAGVDEVNQITSLMVNAFNALPHNTGIAFVGAAPGREPKRVRFIVYGLTERTISIYLERINWSGSFSGIFAALNLMRDHASRFMLVLDINAHGIMPEVGLEFYADSVQVENERALLGSWLFGNASDWPKLLEHLGEQQLCFSEKGQALLTWPCHDRFLTSGKLFRLHMAISHIKLTVTNERLRPKAYVGLSFLPIK